MNQKVLIVDDDANIRIDLEKLLGRGDYDLILAKNGKEALDALAQNNDIAVIICERLMPGIDGIEVLRRTKESSPKTIRIMITESLDTESARKCTDEACVSQFVFKPWNDEFLKEIIEQAVSDHLLHSKAHLFEDRLSLKNKQLQDLTHYFEAKIKERDKEHALDNKNYENNLLVFSGIITYIMEFQKKGLRCHSRRVAASSHLLAKSLDLPEREIINIQTAALLHDVGTMLMPATITNSSPSNFTDKERELFRKHPVIGYELIKNVGGSEEIARLVLYHHESITGNGYPEGLIGDQIPLGSKIIGIADTYDKARFPLGKPSAGGYKEAVDAINMVAGTRLDKDLVKIFIEAGASAYSEEMLVNEQTEGKNSILAECEGEIESKTSSEKVAIKNPGERPLIVVVDDEIHIVNALRRELHRAGYDVEGFTEPVNALNQLHSEEKTYAFITDFNMPGVRGDRLLAHVQKEFPTLPCIVITGQASHDNILLLKKSAKLTRILTKPWKSEDLMSTLAEIRNLSESEEEEAE